MNLRRASEVQNANGNLLTDSQIFLDRWKNYFSGLLNVHGFSNVSQIEIHAAGTSVSEPTSIEAETAIQMLKRHKSRCID
jgi:hypothetical protein